MDPASLELMKNIAGLVAGAGGPVDGLDDTSTGPADLCRPFVHTSLLAGLGGGGASGATTPPLVCAADGFTFAGDTSLILAGGVAVFRSQMVIVDELLLSPDAVRDEFRFAEAPRIGRAARCCDDVVAVPVKLLTGCDKPNGSGSQTGPISWVCCMP
jgi:hypothetical protein